MLTLWLVFAVCALPFVGALAVYTFAPPKSRMNYGELIEPYEPEGKKTQKVKGDKK